jgi:hypothetical protein
MFGVGVGIRVGGFTPISGGGGFDPDAQAFFDRVTTAGGTLTTTEQNATNQLVLDMKSAGIWSAMKAIYPMVGASAAACAQNLKSSSFTGSFSSGWTFSSTGVTPNGTSAFMNTNLNWDANTSLNDVSFGAYLRNLGGNYYGVVQGGGYVLIRTITSCDYYVNDDGTGTITTLAIGLHSATRKNSTQQILYVNGSGTAQTRASLSKPNANFYFGASNGFVTYTSAELSLGFISDGLDATQNSDFYTAVQAFQTTLSRQV